MCIFLKHYLNYKFVVVMDIESIVLNTLISLIITGN